MTAVLADRVDHARPPTSWGPRVFAVVVAGAVAVALVLTAISHGRRPLGFCGGATGPVATGTSAPLTLQVDGDTVVSTVDFDGQLWRAAGGRVNLDGLVPGGTTAIAGTISLADPAEAVFRAQGAYATLLRVTRTDGCATAAIVRAGATPAG